MPSINTSKGHLLAAWTEMIWEGSVKVISINDILHLKFMEKDKIFA